MQNYSVALQKSRLVFVNCEFPGGTITLKKEDLGLDTIPKLFKLGSKEIIDVAQLNVFRTIRTRIYEAGKSQGTMFSNSVYLMDQEPAETFVSFVNEQFEVIRQEMETFLSGYHQMVLDWSQQFPPEIAQKVIAEAPTTDQVRAKFLLSVVCVSIGEPGGKLGDGGLVKKMSNLPMTILGEISSEVNATWAGKTIGRTAVKSLLSRISTKVKPLSFLNDRFNELAALVDQVNSLVPSNPIAGQKTKIDPQTFTLVKGLMDTFLNPEELYLSITNGTFGAVAEEAIVEEPVLAAPTMAAPVMDSQSMVVEVVEVPQTAASTTEDDTKPAPATATATATQMETSPEVIPAPQVLTIQQKRSSFRF